jgi:hypothetical protein
VGVLITKWDKVLWWYCFAWGKCSLWRVPLDGARVLSGHVFGSASMTGGGIRVLFRISVWMSRSFGGFLFSFLGRLRTLSVLLVILVHLLYIKARISDALILRCSLAMVRHLLINGALTHSHCFM